MFSKLKKSSPAPSIDQMEQFYLNQFLSPSQGTDSKAQTQMSKQKNRGFVNQQPTQQGGPNMNFSRGPGMQSGHPNFQGGSAMQPGHPNFQGGSAMQPGHPMFQGAPGMQPGHPNFQGATGMQPGHPNFQGGPGMQPGYQNFQEGSGMGSELPTMNVQGGSNMQSDYSSMNLQGGSSIQSGNYPIGGATWSDTYSMSEMGNFSTESPMSYLETTMMDSNSYSGEMIGHSGNSNTYGSSSAITQETPSLSTKPKPYVSYQRLPSNVTYATSSLNHSNGLTKSTSLSNNGEELTHLKHEIDGLNSSLKKIEKHLGF